MENNNSFEWNTTNTKPLTHNNQIQMNVTPELTKTLSFIGTMQKVFGVLVIIAGALTCLGIISAIVGIPLIIMGVKLFKSGGSFSLTSYTNDGAILNRSLTELASYWKWGLICFILSIAYYLILIIFIVGFMASSGFRY